MSPRVLIWYDLQVLSLPRMDLSLTRYTALERNGTLVILAISQSLFLSYSKELSQPLGSDPAAIAYVRAPIRTVNIKLFQNNRGLLIHMPVPCKIVHYHLVYSSLVRLALAALAMSSHIFAFEVTSACLLRSDPDTL
jgi:hypothetical protein